MARSRRQFSSPRRKSSKRSPLLVAGIFLAVAAAAIIGGSWAINAMITANNQARLERIEEIYSSLQLEPEYGITGQELFGEKHEYEEDAKKSHASWTTYVYSDTVSNTFSALEEKIKAAGFSYVGKPEGRTASKQAYYVSKDGEYIRLSVVSKSYADAFRGAAVVDEISDSVARQFDLDAAPSNVTISVNLDDNNQ